MDAFIEQMKNASVLTQALAVSAGGLIGVFLTLAVFFLIIRLSVKLK
ncbi:MAG TPA: hypothetical protein PLC54_00975 [Spirochaetales bacterium]|nr:hypothetical protein [Spirochaetales bacterium]